MRRGIAFLLLMLLPTLAFAQAVTSSRLSGTVVDEANLPVVEAEVVLESERGVLDVRV